MVRVAYQYSLTGFSFVCIIPPGKLHRTLISPAYFNKLDHRRDAEGTEYLGGGKGNSYWIKLGDTPFIE